MLHLARTTRARALRPHTLLGISARSAGFAAALLLWTAPAVAQQPTGSGGRQAPATGPQSPEPPAPVDESTKRGRDAYLKGIEFAKAEQWGNALVAFEEAAAARDAPLVQFNIAYCLRALGHYVAARERTARVLEDPTGLAPTQVEEAKAYLTEFEQVLVKVKVTLDPPTAVLTVDGRPLQPSKGDVFLGSVAPPGEGTAPGKKSFTIVLDPGVHLVRASRPGHQDAVVRKSYRAGDKTNLDLRLDILPATIAVKSEPGSAIVRIDAREVGVAPIEFQRPAGRYKLEVVRDEFETYAATLDLRPGQRADLTAKLVPYEEPIVKKWWFWTAAVVVVAGGVVLTYALTRPEPTPPPYDGGSTGWVVQPQALRW